MTEENRKDLVKIIKQKAELARISLRNVREDVRSKIMQDEKAKVISEDDRFNLMQELDEVINKNNEKIQAIADEKEQEVMAI